MCEHGVSYLIHCKRFIPPGEQVAENSRLLLCFSLFMALKFFKMVILSCAIIWAFCMFFFCLCKVFYSFNTKMLYLSLLYTFWKLNFLMIRYILLLYLQRHIQLFSTIFPLFVDRFGRFLQFFYLGFDNEANSDDLSDFRKLSFCGLCGPCY